jgi:LCP family protein required for cell wall assembly
MEGRARRRRRPVRLLGILLLVVLLLAVAVSWWVSSRIPRIEVDGLASSGRPMHVLVVGSDTREGLSDDEVRDLTIGRGFEGERTDTIFVMTIRGSSVAMLAFPRDLLVTRCDGSEGRINAAEAVGGPSCLVSTVRDVSGIDVQHYVRVTFGGFRDIVDAVGGVELCLEDAIADRDAGIDLRAGCQVLDGTDALGYVRVRKIDDDLHRIQRQQQFLRALAREIAAPLTLFNPVRAVSLSGEVGDAIAVSDSMGMFALGRMAWGGRGLASGQSVSYTVPADPARTSGGADVLIIRETEAEPIFARFRDGSVLDETAEGVRPEDVRTSVLNGAEISGLAGRVGDLLGARGFDVVDVGNADPRDSTVIRHPPGQRAEADLVAGNLPVDADFEETSDVTSVTVVLGRDAAGVL